MQLCAWGVRSNPEAAGGVETHALCYPRLNKRQVRITRPCSACVLKRVGICVVRVLQTKRVLPQYRSVSVHGEFVPRRTRPNPEVAIFVNSHVLNSVRLEHHF